MNKSYDLARQLGIKTMAGCAVLEAALKIAQTVDKKQQDYGPHSIVEFGVKGCVVRLFDKLHRLKNLLFGSERAFDEEIEKIYALVTEARHVPMSANRVLEDVQIKIREILKKQEKKPNFESIEDTLLDGAAYNLIGYAVLTNKWPSSLEFIPAENPA